MNSFLTISLFSNSIGNFIYRSIRFSSNVVFAPGIMGNSAATTNRQIIAPQFRRFSLAFRAETSVQGKVEASLGLDDCISIALDFPTFLDAKQALGTEGEKQNDHGEGCCGLEV